MQPEITVSWADWLDADSGVYEYDIEILPLSSQGGSLNYNDHGEDFLPIIGSLPSDKAFTEFILPKSGPYAVLLTVKDKAKNFKMARRLLLFDNASMIEINEENPSIIKSADTETEFKWINKLTPRVEVSWVGRFINKMVHTNGWLNETATDENISRDLDDNMGASARNTSSIYNIDDLSG